MLIVVRCEIWI